jgi:hypothetical protein
MSAIALATLECLCLRFCDTDTLPLSTAYPTNEIVADLGIKCVIKTEDGHYNIAHMGCILLSCYTMDPVPGGWKSILVTKHTLLSVETPTSSFCSKL